MAVDNIRYDLKLDADGDLYISVNGDFVLAPSDEQHIQDCIYAGPNWWKQYPDNGVNIGIYQNGSFDRQSLERLVQIQLRADGYRASPEVKLDAAGELEINTNINP